MAKRPFFVGKNKFFLQILSLSVVVLGLFAGVIIVSSKGAVLKQSGASSSGGGPGAGCLSSLCATGLRCEASKGWTCQCPSACPSTCVSDGRGGYECPNSQRCSANYACQEAIWYDPVPNRWSEGDVVTYTEDDACTGLCSKKEDCINGACAARACILNGGQCSLGYDTCCSSDYHCTNTGVGKCVPNSTPTPASAPTSSPVACSGVGGSCMSPHYCCSGLSCSDEAKCQSTPKPTSNPTTKPTVKPTPTPCPRGHTCPI